MQGTRDVVVVGAGPAGSTTAALLAEAGHDVLLLDRARFPRPKPCAEYASPGAAAILARLGALARLQAGVGRRLRGMELHAPDGAHHLLEYGAAGQRGESVSVERLHLDAALVDVARARGAEVWEGCSAVAMRMEATIVRGIEVLDASRRSVALRARLVVAADGIHSTAVRDLALHRPVPLPRRLGLVCHVRGVLWPEEYGQMWVGRNSYVGVAPVADDVVSVGLVRAAPPGHLGPPATALDSALAEYPELAARLGQGERVSGIQGVGPLAHAVRRTAGPGYLLVGDAAGFLDPFTGEGIYRALRGAEIAADLADHALRDRGADVVDVSHEYSEARRLAFQAKERLTWLIQLFVRSPALMSYAVARLRARPAAAAQLGNVLGDLAPASGVLRSSYLWQLLRP